MSRLYADPEPLSEDVDLAAVVAEREKLSAVALPGVPAAVRALAATNEQLLDGAEAAERAGDGEALGALADELAANADAQERLVQRAQAALPTDKRVRYRGEGQTARTLSLGDLTPRRLARVRKRLAPLFVRRRSCAPLVLRRPQRRRGAGRPAQRWRGAASRGSGRGSPDDDDALPDCDGSRRRGPGWTP